MHLFPKGGRAEARSKRFNEPHGCPPAHLPGRYVPRYLPPEPAMTACCLGGSSATGMRTSTLTTPMRTGGSSEVD